MNSEIVDQFIWSSVATLARLSVLNDVVASSQLVAQVSAYRRSPVILTGDYPILDLRSTGAATAYGRSPVVTLAEDTVDVGFYGAGDTYLLLTDGFTFYRPDNLYDVNVGGGRQLISGSDSTVRRGDS